MDMNRGTILTQDQWLRMLTLMSLINDCNVTQIDQEESAELDDLLYKLRHDGEELPG